MQSVKSWLAEAVRRPGARLIWASTGGLAVLAAATFYVSFRAQFTFMYAVKHQDLPALVEALIADVAMVTCSLLALGMACAGQSAKVARLLVVLFAGLSAGMNYLAADVSSFRTRIITAVQTRWAARGAPAALEPEDPAGGNERICPGCGWGIPADSTCPTCKANQEAGQPDPGTGPTYSWGPADSPSGWPVDDAETAHRWAQHMSTGGKPYVVTEYPPGGGPGRTVATYAGGKPAPDHTDTDGGTSEMPASPSRIKTEHRARRAAARSGGSVPSEWGPVIAQTADFEPEDDGELLEWMSRQVTGLSAWAEALVDFYDHATNTIGIDLKASAMLHDVADAAAQAAETMGAAKAKFTEHYELPREFAGNGGLMTHDGRWITGEGA
jgi:hypothetical protein